MMYILLCLFLMVIWMIQYIRITTLQNKNFDQQRQIDELYTFLRKEQKAFSFRLPIELRQRIESLIEQGKKIQAIKEVRDASGASLKEAKEYVESFDLL